MMLSYNFSFFFSSELKNYFMLKHIYIIRSSMKSVAASSDVNFHMYFLYLQIDYYVLIVLFEMLFAGEISVALSCCLIA